MTANENGFALLKQVPMVLRARGYRLYTDSGGKSSGAASKRRLIDLWLNGGAAVLGHTQPDFLREIKNTASRGLYAPLPHFTEGRFIKALSKLFPGYSFRLYSAPPSELFASSGTASKNNISFWRPFADPSASFAAPFAVTENPPDGNAPLLIPVIPGIQTWRKIAGVELPMGLCVVAASAQQAASQQAASQQAASQQAVEDRLSHLPPSDILPPVLLAAATRGVHNLIASPQRATPSLPRTFKTLKEIALSELAHSERMPPTARWERKGIYLTRREKLGSKEWEMLFQRFLAEGFLLPPTPSHPLILPGELSDGEDAKLAKVLQDRD
ncbi:MAG: hypothetical protein LBU66_00065 [Treponema sp.]|jgi:hypothetical protein|nr:hypothetical protein [Treponema sp.]